MRSVDLNCDLGESYGLYKMGDDERILPFVTSVNIACGFHAGDPLVMESTVNKALERKIAIGAHPGFPDLLGFGRRIMHVSPEEAKAYIIYQVSALNGFVKALGGKMQHVKPHGALYNMAAVDYRLARAIAEGVYAVDEELVLVGLAGTELIRAGKDIGLKTASEVFADRAYQPEGTLVPRGESGAVIRDKGKAASQVLDMVINGKVTAIDGSKINIVADTICVHGDHEETVELVKYLHKKLQEQNVEIRPLSRKINV